MKKIERREDAAKVLDDYEDDGIDYAGEDRKACESQGHPFTYVTVAFGPICDCGERMGPLAGFPDGDIAQWRLNSAIYEHDRELSGDGKGQ